MSFPFYKITAVAKVADFIGSVCIATRKTTAAMPITCAVAMMIYERTLSRPLSNISGIMHNNSEDYCTQYILAVSQSVTH